MLRKVETPDGFNVIICERYAALFSKDSEAQVDLLIESVNKEMTDREKSGE